MSKENVPFRNINVPLLGNGQVSQEQRVKLEIMQAIQSLSLSIYSKLAQEHLSVGHSHIDVEKLKTMAKNSRLAAQAYFEGLGVIEPQ